MNKIITSFLILLSAAFLFGCTAEQEKTKPSGNSIKIGVIGPMSGKDKVLGEDSLKGIRTALHMRPYLNNGDIVELLVVDDKNQPALAAKAFKRLVDKDKVAAVIVTSSSASGLVVNSLADKYQTPVLFLLASHPDISKNTKFVSQICFDNTFQASVAALFVRDELLLERVAVFKNPDSYHSSSLADEFMRKFRSIDGHITDVISMSSTTDYGKILSQLRDSNVQFLYLPMAVRNVIEIRKHLSVMGWYPKGMGADGILTRAIVEQPEGVRYLEGLLATDLYSATVELTPYGRGVLKAFQSLYESRNSTFPAIGVEGMGILMDAINRCGEHSDRECINTKLHNTVDFEGLMGNITIQSNGKVSRPLVVNRIRDEQLEFVVKVY